jgi:hypothetical protein
VNANEKTACADWLPAVVTVQVGAVPVQLPRHSLKVEPVPAVAFSITAMPSLKSAEQVPGQAMPAGTLATEPVPLPRRIRVSVFWVAVPVSGPEILHRSLLVSWPMNGSESEGPFADPVKLPIPLPLGWPFVVVVNVNDPISVLDPFTVPESVTTTVRPLAE